MTVNVVHSETVASCIGSFLLQDANMSISAEEGEAQNVNPSIMIQNYDLSNALMVSGGGNVGPLGIPSYLTAGLRELAVREVNPARLAGADSIARQIAIGVPVKMSVLSQADGIYTRYTNSLEWSQLKQVNMVTCIRDYMTDAVLFVDNFAELVVSRMFTQAITKLDELIAVVDANIENFYTEWYPYEDVSEEYVTWFLIHTERLKYMRDNVSALRAQAELPETQDIALVHAQKHKFVTCVLYGLEACLSANHTYVHTWKSVSTSDIAQHTDEQLRCLFGLHDFQHMLKITFADAAQHTNVRGEIIDLSGHPFLFSSVKSFGVVSGWRDTSPECVSIGSTAYAQLEFKETLAVVESELTARYHELVAENTSTVCAGHMSVSTTNFKPVDYSHHQQQTIQMLRCAVTMRLGKFVGEMAQHILLLERRLGVAGNALSGNFSF